MVSNILIWNEKAGFIRINEGTGDNLLQEDEAQGYVDYIILSFMEYDGDNLVESDGAQVMLYEMYQSKFKSEKDVVKYLIETNWIPNDDYIYLYLA